MTELKTQKKTIRKKIIGVGVMIMMIPTLAGCGIIDMALTDMGIVKDENGGRRLVTQEERREAEENGRLNVGYQVASSEINGRERTVKVVIDGDPLKVTENDIKLISEVVWLNTKMEADFSRLDVLIYKKTDNMDGSYTIGKGTYVTKGVLSSPEDYRTLQNYDYAFELAI